MYKNFTKTTWLIMRLTIVILVAGLMQVSAATFAQLITINQRNASLEQILKDIRTQSKYDFVFNRNLFAGTKPVDIAITNGSLEAALDAAFNGQPLTYTIEGKAVLIKLKKASFFDQLKAAFFAIRVSGRVLDQSGLPLPGAVIKIKGQQAIATSGATGAFTADVPGGTVLEISFVGYKTQEITITENNATFTVNLIADVSKLDEVTVEGYRTGSQRLGTGNTSKVTSEEIMKQPVGNILQALQGRMTGVVVNQVSGVPGARLNLQIRGRSNFDNFLSSDQPLFILDGVPLAAGNNRVSLTSGPFGPGTADGLSALSGINPADIESIDVLKDADATAIYGSRGANGVVLITTKSAKAGKMTLNANVTSGVSTATALPKMLNTEQYLAMRKEAFANDNLAQSNTNAYDLKIWDQNRYTDFADLLVGNSAQTTDVQTTLSGGSASTQYRVGAAYRKEGTVWPGDMSMDKISTNFNIKSSSQDEKFTMNLSGIFSANKSNLMALDIASAVTLPPNFKLYEENGKLAWNEGGLRVQGKENPLAMLEQTYLSNMSNINGNLTLNYKVVKNLTLRSSFGYNATENEEKRLTPIAAQNPLTPNISGFSGFGTSRFKSWIIEPQAQYKRAVGKGELDVLLGGTFNKINTSNLQATGRGYTSDELLGSLAGASSTQISGTNALTDYKYQAIFGRINYNWQDKYIVNFTGRRDGSSRFGPEYRFSNFGAVGGAWLFSNEDFLKDNAVLSYGKLRASYGVTGNDQIGEYQYLDAWTSTSNYADSATLYQRRLYNPDLHWERNTKLEVGLELGFFKERVLLSVSAYENNSSEPLVTYQLPKLTGFSTVVRNLDGVQVQNRGLEIVLNTKNFTRRAFSWSTDFNITVPRNVLKKYPDLLKSSYATRYAIGESLNRIFSAQYLGVDSETGLYVVKDLNGDNLSNTADYATRGFSDPKFFGGVNNNFNYKRFSASFFLQFTSQLGRDWRTSAQYNPPGTAFNVPTLALDRWQSPGQQTDVQKFTTAVGAIYGTSGFYAMSFSSAAYTDASFLRLKNLYVSYNLNPRWLESIHINAVKLYVQGQNLFVISGYKGSDPETQNYTRMPPLRTIMGGLQLTL